MSRWTMATLGVLALSGGSPAWAHDVGPGKVSCKVDPSSNTLEVNIDELSRGQDATCEVKPHEYLSIERVVFAPKVRATEWTAVVLLEGRGDCKVTTQVTNTGVSTSTNPFECVPQRTNGVLPRNGIRFDLTHEDATKVTQGSKVTVTTKAPKMEPGIAFVATMADDSTVQFVQVNRASTIAPTTCELTEGQTAWAQTSTSYVKLVADKPTTQPCTLSVADADADALSKELKEGGPLHITIIQPDSGKSYAVSRPMPESDFKSWCDTQSAHAAHRWIDLHHLSDWQRPISRSRSLPYLMCIQVGQDGAVSSEFRDVAGYEIGIRSTPRFGRIQAQIDGRTRTDFPTTRLQDIDAHAERVNWRTTKPRNTEQPDPRPLLQVPVFPILPWLVQNRPIDVVIRNLNDKVDGVRVKGTGVVASGHEEPILDVDTAGGGAPDSKKLLSGPSGGAIPDDTTLAYTRLMPRQPGPWTLEVEQFTDGTDKDKNPITHTKRNDSLEAVTLRSYFGALRVGVGLSYIVNDRKFALEKFGDQARLTVVNNQIISPEFVVGFAPFLRPGGRVYYPNRFDVRVAPYFGISVLGASAAPTGIPVSFFRSFHLGMEVETGRYASIAFVGSLRLIEIEQANRPVGSLFPNDTTEATTLGVSGGVGIVLSFSPVYFKNVTQFATTFRGVK